MALIREHFDNSEIRSNEIYSFHCRLLIKSNLDKQWHLKLSTIIRQAAKISWGLLRDASDHLWLTHSQINNPRQFLIFNTKYNYNIIREKARSSKIWIYWDSPMSISLCNVQVPVMCVPNKCSNVLQLVQNFKQNVAKTVAFRFLALHLVVVKLAKRTKCLLWLNISE